MILNKTTNSVLSRRPRFATGFRDRLQGMIGRGFDAFDAIVFPRCSAIHTFFMSRKLDVIFLDSHNQILRTIPVCPAWRPAFTCPGASSVIELPEGTLTNTRTEPGNLLELTF